MKNLKNRRDFLKVTGAGVLGISLLPSRVFASALADRKSFGVGIQLYSIRDAMSEDPLGSLQKVAKMGYKYVELADYANGKFYKYAPAEFNKIVTDLGMQVLSSHSKVEAKGVTLDNAKKMADDHAQLGVKYCIQPWVNPEDRTIEKYKQMIADLNEAARIMKAVGIQFGYHNHNFEFATVDGIVPYYDLFMKEMDADLITMELDLYWVSKAGVDPVELFKKYPGRFQLLHMKDKAVESAPIFDTVKDDITPVGEGVIDFKRILAAKEIAGAKYLIVEDDNQGNGKPFKGIETSINNLTTEILV